MKGRTYRLALTACLTALALGVFVLESLLPSLPLPGAKIGLANLFSLFALVAVGWPSALVIVVVRVTLGCIITGNVGAMIYSLTAGLSSVLLGGLLLRLVPKHLSVVGLGVAQAVCHNVTQCVVYCLVVANWAMMAYLPYLLAFGVVGGLVVGLLTWWLTRRLPPVLWQRLALPKADAVEHTGDAIQEENSAKKEK